ncbi:MAG: hypothetical protein COA99_08275 [Moraxellaceae bacterium]|nr:MAG: hypothetical protein COA99_08275 [Moraxellaceae bacterium]
MIDLPIVLDLEASGFGRGSYPIEVGLAMDDAHAHLIAHLIKPFDHWTHWQESAENIHGIPRDQLLLEGKDPSYVADELNSLLRGKTVYSDGWGVDRSWLALLFHETGIYQGFKMDSIFSLLSEDQLENWNDNKAKVLELTGMQLHRAGTDALIIQQTYLYTVNKAGFDESLARLRVV